MQTSLLKEGLKVKINIQEGMKVVGGENVDEFSIRFFGHKTRVQEWMKKYNLFQIVDVNKMAGGIFEDGEKWCFVEIEPLLVGGISKDDFSYETENDNGEMVTVSTIIIENFLLDIVE